MIELQQVCKVFHAPDGREVHAVKNITLTVEEGETVCLIGTSGSGKTTTMKMINRLINPTSGKILVGGRDVLEQDPIQLRRGIGYVIQKGGLFPHLTVRANVAMLCRLENWEASRTRARVDELLSLVNLPPDEYAERYPGELSGGQRQRVGVARALALDPDYILMDEPFGALDPITRDQIHDEFTTLKERVKKTIVIVTHDMAEAFKLGDRIALMHNGEMIQCGSEDHFRSHPANEFVVDFLKSHLSRPTTAQEIVDPEVPVVTRRNGVRMQLVQVQDTLVLHCDDQSWELKPIAANCGVSQAFEEMLDGAAPGVAVADGERVLGVITRESLMNAL